MNLAIQLIEAVVCEGEGIQVKVLSNKTRKKEITEARQIIFTLAQEVGITQSLITGNYGQDHATAIHARKKIYGLCDVYPEFRDKIEEYRIMLGISKIASKEMYLKLINEIEKDIAELEKKITTLKAITYKLKNEQDESNKGKESM